tara:strand:- start:15837 stop:16424 length:588 start_codon:yes stop_codon:yes gene_type:complete
MDKNKITVDLDLTTVPSDKTWFEWLKSCSTVFYEDSYNHDLLNEEVDYFLPTYFELYDGIDPMDFWAEKRTYPSTPLLPDAYRVIKNLYEAGYDITFVSYCMNCEKQYKNKLKYLQRTFDFMDVCFIPTEFKGKIVSDYIIDDRNKFLAMMPEHVKLVKMKTPYTQCTELDSDFTLVNNWCEIEDYFVNELEEGE